MPPNFTRTASSTRMHSATDLNAIPTAESATAHNCMLLGNQYALADVLEFPGGFPFHVRSQPADNCACVNLKLRDCRLFRMHTSNNNGNDEKS